MINKATLAVCRAGRYRFLSNQLSKKANCFFSNKKDSKDPLEEEHRVLDTEQLNKILKSHYEPHGDAKKHSEYYVPQVKLEFDKEDRLLLYQCNDNMPTTLTLFDVISVSALMYGTYNFFNEGRPILTGMCAIGSIAFIPISLKIKKHLGRVVKSVYLDKSGQKLYYNTFISPELKTLRIGELSPSYYEVKHFDEERFDVVNTTPGHELVLSSFKKKPYIFDIDILGEVLNGNYIKVEE